jgi:ABC-2 type transport system permease protein
MNSILVLLSPFWLTWRNDFLRGKQERGRRYLLLLLGAAFWFGVYFGVRRVLLYLYDVHELGPALAYQLLLIILLTFLSLLLFSNLINALSAFFLARDLDLVLSAPVGLGSFYYSRLITTTVHSSWMVLFFSLPVFAAYAAVFGGGAVFCLWVLLVLPLFLLIPAAVGIFVTHLLVYFLPAKRIRDMLFFTGLLAFVALYLLFRFSQPERLVNPESFGHFAQFLTAMETPSAPFLPSAWSAEVLAATLFNKPTEQGFYYALLASYALFFPLAASWVSGAVYRLVQSPGGTPGNPQLAGAGARSAMGGAAFSTTVARHHGQRHQDIHARHHAMVAGFSAGRSHYCLPL